MRPALLFALVAICATAHDVARLRGRGVLTQDVFDPVTVEAPGAAFVHDPLGTMWEDMKIIMEEVKRAFSSHGAVLLQVDPQHGKKEQGAAHKEAQKKDETGALIAKLQGIKTRLRKHIVNANKEEQKEKQLFVNMEKNHKHSKAMEKAIQGMRETQHDHYRAMLKVSHAGLERVTYALHLLDNLKNGQRPSPKEMKALNSMIPASL